MLTPLDYNLPHPAFRPHQLESIQWLADCTPFVPKITEQPTGCHAKGQGILMYDGSIKKVEDVVVGDVLMGTGRQPRTVLALHRGKDKMHLVVPQTGQPFIVNEGHVLSIYSIYLGYIDISILGYYETDFIRRQRLHMARETKYGIDELVQFNVYPLHVKMKYYGFTIDGDSRYLLADGTVTRNSGKSSIAMAQANNGQVIVVTKSKNLQTQYGDLYSDCAVLFGRANYPCVHRAALPNETANDCRFRENMHKCPVAEACPYLIAKENAKASQRVALNYAYWLTTYKKWNPHYLVLDEAHNLSDIVLDWVGCTVTGTDCERWHLPELPVITTGSHNPLFPSEDQTPVAVTWLSAAITILGKRLTQIEAKLMTEANLRDKHACENLSRKLTTTRDALATQPGEHWYLRSGPDVTWQGKGFICKPLTARYDASRFFFDKRERVLAMSATIGNVESFTTELGIAKYDFRTVPNQWGVESRPIHVLDTPSMGKSATEKSPSNFDLQAKAIANAIHQLPKDWHGLILATRKHECQLIAERLAKYGLEKRVWVMPGVDTGSYVSTNEQINQWQQRKERVAGSIACAWSQWEGFNGVQEKFIIAAKCPYPRQDDYERARMQYNFSFYLQRTGYFLTQGLGRTRRGEIGDYDDPKNGIINGFVAIADKSWTRVKKYLPQDIREAIVVT
jgi:hypothetical protein